MSVPLLNTCLIALKLASASGSLWLIVRLRRALTAHEAPAQRATPDHLQEVVGFARIAAQGQRLKGDAL